MTDTYVPDDSNSLSLNILVLNVVVGGMGQQTLEFLEPFNLRPLPSTETPDAEDQDIASFFELIRFLRDAAIATNSDGPFSRGFIPLSIGQLVLELNVLSELILVDNSLDVVLYLSATGVESRPLGL